MSEIRRRRVHVSNNSSESHESLNEDLDEVTGTRRVSEANLSSESHTDDGQQHRSSHSSDSVDDDDLSDSVIIEYEREEGDGQECVPPKEKKLDDDEDRRNPQYIPKRGTFYEHDDRTVVGDEDAEEEQENEVERAGKEGPADKKKVWRENENKWIHDKYIADEQVPKSREELIAIYGYDIRCEEGPPRARRRRRYGRGPNKYTRNWEDVDAYGKPAVAVRGSGRRGRGGKQRGGAEEEFPPLAGSQPSGALENGGVVLQSVTYSNCLASTDKPAEAKHKPGSGSVFPPLTTDQDATRGEERTSVVKENASDSVSANAWKKDGGYGHKEEVSWQNTNVTRGMESSGKSLAAAHSEESSSWRKGGAPKVADTPHVAVESSWRGGRGRAKQPEAMAPVTVAPLRGRGRGLRGSRGRSTMAEFITSSKLGKPGRSVSETRVPRHHHDDVEPVVNQVWVNSQIIVPTQDDLSKEMSGLLIAEEPHTNSRDYQRRSKNGQQGFQQSGDRRQAVVPPRLQDSAANRPKRYSSLRQRGAQEAAGMVQPPAQPPLPYPQPHGFYQQGYVQQAVYSDAPPQQQSVVQQVAPTTSPPLQLLPPQAPPYVPPPPYPPGQQFIPAQVIAAAAQSPYPGPPLINYVAPSPSGQFAPQSYPPFQHTYTAVAPGPPAELYQPQGGITYYSPEEQVMHRPITTQKRQRAAIPIVPPPERKVQSLHQEAEDPAGGGDATVAAALQHRTDAYEDETDPRREEFHDVHATTEQAVLMSAQRDAQA